MKTLACILALFAAGTASAFAVVAVPASTLADWTFETSVPATSGPFSPEIGSGSARGFHAGVSTYSSPVGNGSSHSFSSNTWAAGDYYQFLVNASGFANIKLSWDQISSGTGPAHFSLSYSTDGMNFTDTIASYTILANSTPNVWSSATHISASSYNFDFSSISAVNNQATVFFRLKDLDTVSAAGGVVGTGGTDRVDNVLITAVAIPEPSTCALLAGLGCAAFIGWKRRATRS
jgi:hypothetical protein